MSRDQQQEQKQSGWAIAAAICLIAGVVIGGVFLVKAITPGKVSTGNNPSFIDNIVDDRTLLVMIRIALLFGATYVVISVVGLISGQRWLEQLGPLKVSSKKPVRTIDNEAERLRTELGSAVDTIETLRTRLAESDGALASARADIADLLARIDKMDSIDLAG